jgi:two-component system, sensor histidine kinase and response regulator
MVNPSAHTILVIDDECASVETIKTVFLQNSYVVRHFSQESDINTFLHLVDENPGATELPDVILINHPMVDMDGLGLCRRIKSNYSFRYVPVIVMVEDPLRGGLTDAIQAGADEVIGKPLNDVELRSRLQAQLRIKQHYNELLNTLQMREDLSNMVVHDLRNPITNILLSAQLLMTRQALSAKDYERLQLIQASSKKLRLMIDDLLTVAKMQAGKLMLTCSEINLNLLVPYVVENLAAVAEDRHIQIQMCLMGEGQFLSVDANLIQRMLENLLSNALKFSPSNSTVVIRVDYPKAVEGRARIRILDEGPGVHENLRSSIFEKFSTGQAVNDTPQIGLGLTFCKLVAEAHGGRIRVEPNQPRGSVFTVEL